MTAIPKRKRKSSNRKKYKRVKTQRKEKVVKPRGNFIIGNFGLIFMAICDFMFRHIMWDVVIGFRNSTPKKHQEEVKKDWLRRYSLKSSEYYRPKARPRRNLGKNALEFFF